MKQDDTTGDAILLQLVQKNYQLKSFNARF
jgi:hypothetical protein